VPRLHNDYHPELVEASLSVLAEVMTTLRSYRDSLVLIGGWVPYLILQEHQEPGIDFGHVGSIDIDLLIDPNIAQSERYATIVGMLTDRGYTLDPQAHFRLHRTVTGSGGRQEYSIAVDFLTPRPPPGDGRAHRHRTVQSDLRAHTLEGGEIALTHNFWFSLEATLPGDGRTSVRFRVADLVACLSLKGSALGERYAEKDAYDVYALCAYHRGGPSAVAVRLKPHVHDQRVQRGLDSVASKFRDPEAEGPSWVAKFLPGGDNSSDDAVRVRTDAFMVVNEVLRLLGRA
jgi:hypothetical protein